MILHNRESVMWLWLDPLRRLRHHVFKSVYGIPHGVDRVVYATYCGYNVTVDDVNPKTVVTGSPTCMCCIIAAPVADVIPTQE